jgi:hypothetical protein
MYFQVKNTLNHYNILIHSLDDLLGGEDMNSPLVEKNIYIFFNFNFL